MKKLSLQELNRVDIATFKTQIKTPVILVLDNVRSALNVGSAFRTADAFALEKIMLCGITAQPPHREILKTAIGATESVTWEYFEETSQAITVLKEKDYQLAAVEQADESISLEKFNEQVPIFTLGSEKKENQKLALIFGNEVMGVSDEVMGQIDCCIEVPQFGTKHSLNISVCIGVVVWEVFRSFKYG